MNQKEPVLLTILIDTSRMRWLAGGISLDRHVFPLLASRDNDLAGYRSMEFDEQASFLRHRFCGALQRGCDRLWGLQKKACQFVFLMDRPFPDAPTELTTRIAEHLVNWMTNPPVVFLVSDNGAFDQRPVDPSLLAGSMQDDLRHAFEAGLPSLLEAVAIEEHWEQVPLPRAAGG